MLEKSLSLYLLLFKTLSLPRQSPSMIRISGLSYLARLWDRLSPNKHKQEYRACRAAYESDIKEAKVFASDTSMFSFDFQQVVEIPSMPQQLSQSYYWSPFKLYVFGIVNDAIDQHYHAMFTEAQQWKGANQVVSLLHCFLTSIKQLTPKVHLWADNCGGQNKNKTMLWYLSWLVATQDIEEIILRFQIKGHTRNSVDRGFGTVKQKANRM